MFSGLYSHNNKVEGFYQVKDPGWPHMVDLFEGTPVTIRFMGKVSHSSPYQPYAWDDDLTISPSGEKVSLKDAKAYGASTSRGLKKQKGLGSLSFCRSTYPTLTNPFGRKCWGKGKTPTFPAGSSRATKCLSPAFFDDPQVREELALYYSSVRRADDCLAQVLRCPEKSGQAKNTMVVLSDHGMPLPFAKTQLYLQHGLPDGPFARNHPGR